MWYACACACVCVCVCACVCVALLQAEDEMVRRTSSRHPLDWVYWEWLTKANSDLARAKGIIRRKVRGVIDRRMERGVEDEDEDLLKHLMDTDDQEIVVDNCITMMWAGHDTTAAALSFAIHLLSAHTGIQDDLRAELQGLADADDRGGKLDADAVRLAPLLDAVVLETLRLVSCWCG